jgi:hypothetical protein
VSYPNLDIHKSNIVVTVAHWPMVGNILTSMVLCSKTWRCSWTSCLWQGN